MLGLKRLSSLSDEQLMRRAAKDNERAFEELYNRHARRLQGFFVRRLDGDVSLASDFMHDTFLRLYSARATYQEGRNFRTWLFTVAYNLCKNHRRLPQPQFLSAGDPDEGMFAQDEFVKIVEVDLSESALHDALRQVLQSLPEPYAMLFSLHYEEELTIPQISHITSLNESVVKSRLQIIINTIKQKLKQYENH